MPEDLNEVFIEVITAGAEQAMLKEDQVDIGLVIMLAQLLKNDYWQEDISEHCGKYLRLTREDIKEGINMVE